MVRLRVYFEEEGLFKSVNMILRMTPTYERVERVLKEKHPKAYNIIWRILK